MTHDQIANVLNEVGQKQRFVGVMNRMLNKPKPDHRYGAFDPGDVNEEFASAAVRQVPQRLGWRREYSILTQAGRQDRGWSVIFEVLDNGTSRIVLAKVRGDSDRKEVERFLQHVYDRLWWDQSESSPTNA